MRINKEASDFAGDIVSAYAKYDNDAKGDYLSVDDVPDSNLFEFACVLMGDESRALEATSPDNPQFNKMFSTLMTALKEPQDPDSYIEFVSSWRAGLINYFEKTMQKLINDKIHDRSYEGSRNEE